MTSYWGEGVMLGEEPVVTQVLKHWFVVLGRTITNKEQQKKKRNIKGS